MNTSDRPHETGGQESEDLYRSLLNHMLNGFCYCQLLFNEQGRPVDFVYLTVNDAFEARTGLKNVVGKKVSEVIPGFLQSDPGIFETYARVAMTGRAETFEAYVDAMKMWFSISAYSPKKDFFAAVFDVVTDRKNAEADQELLATVVKQAAEVIVVTDAKGIMQFVNPAFEQMMGYTRAEAVGQHTRMLKSGLQEEAFYRALWTTITAGETWEGRLVNKKKDGTVFTEEASISPVRNASGAITNFVAIKRDITELLKLQGERQKLQGDLAQAQKMDSIGRLAGGVAHDFNNMLSVILGYTELALQQSAPAEPMYELLEEIQGAAKRSADLTRQLLAFARKQTTMPKVLDLAQTVTSMLKILRRLIGEDTEFSFVAASDLWPVKIDPAQVDQMLANLCVNARDAIKGIGKISIELTNATLDGEFCRQNPGAVQGPYVALQVADTGGGMSRETLDHLFEPFYTTKEVGRGTGLGLATVYGIVKQNNGYVAVTSEPGRGTSFRIFLPKFTEEAAGTAPAAGPATPSRGQGETVLLMEDEPGIINIVKSMLTRLGYNVLVASSPKDALDTFGAQKGTVRLVITDVVMPGMNGRELVSRIKAVEPAIKCLFMSGYTADIIAQHGVIEEGLHFIQKPFSIQDLAREVEAALK